MKNFRLFIIVLSILILCGCERADNEYSENKELDKTFYVYVDKDTCVEYFASYGMYNAGDIHPIYNADGTLKLNKKCLKDKKEEENE